jgi:hypothetical protein
MRFTRITALSKVGFLILLSAYAAAAASPQKAFRMSVKKGWVIQRDENQKESRFFAIGNWHVPGYTFTNKPEADQESKLKNEQNFRERTAPVNMVFVSRGQQKEYMAEKIHVMNPFSAVLHNYLDRIPGLPAGNDKDYYRSQYIKSAYREPEFIQYLDSQMVGLLANRTNDKLIYSHIDEISLGGVSKWAVPPSVGAIITQRLKRHDRDALVFVDLLGHARGSTYLFEKRYLQSHKALPGEPPYGLIDQEALKCKLPLLGFSQAYEGTPVYDFKDGNYSYKNHSPEFLKTIWAENIRIIAKDYRKCGDVFGINAFRDFFANPELAGITVDALRDGLGDKVPLWIYFDGNGYARPASVTPDAYLKSVECQIYTAIVHGATGILFWNDWAKTPEVYEKLLPILEKLNRRLDVVKMDTYQTIVDGHTHLLIKGNRRGEKHVIATNTSKTDTLQIRLPGGQTLSLAPLEVYFDSSSSIR